MMFRDRFPAILIPSLLATALLGGCSSAPKTEAPPLAVVDPVQRGDLPEWARPYYFKKTPFKPDEAIAPPPEAGSEEDRRELDEIKARIKTRTKAMCALADSQAIPTLQNSFASRPGARDLPDFSKLPPDAYGKVKELFERVQRDMGFMSVIAKEHWKKVRPNFRDEAIRPCVRLERTFAYPSGHAAFGEMGALVLSEVMPSRAQALRKAGALAGEHRVIGGIHHPSDVRGGAELARKTWAALQEIPEFRADLAAVREALAATKPAR